MALPVNGLQAAEAKRNIYRIQIGDDPKELLTPAWWNHVCTKMRVDDIVEVMALDRSWFGIVTVLEVGKGAEGGARVAYVLGPQKITNAAEVGKQADHEARWGGPHAKWTVVRAKDKLVMKSGLESREDAGTWIAENLKAA
jgi:hypothetical protein